VFIAKLVPKLFSRFFEAPCSHERNYDLKLFEDIARIRQRHFVVASCRRPGLKKVDEIAATTRIRQRHFKSLPDHGDVRGS
jgi:hypothetical protein